MLLAKVPAVEGVPAVGNCPVFEAQSLSSSEAVAYLGADTLQNGWTRVPDLEYLAYWDAGVLVADKEDIVADGVDAAILTVIVSVTITEVVFYDEAGEEIIKAQVDPETQEAMIEIRATVHGIIKVRVGKPTATRLNEVIIHAVEAS